MLYEGTRDVYKQITGIGFVPSDEEVLLTALKEKIFPKYFPIYNKVCRLFDETMREVS